MATILVHVGVGATDLDRSVAFWEDVLGLRLVGTEDGSVDLSDGLHNFRLFQHRGPVRPPHVSGLMSYVHIGVLVGSLDEVYERCVASGSNVVVDDIDTARAPEAGRRPEQTFKVEDPDGIVIDVTASPDQWPGTSVGRG